MKRVSVVYKRKNGVTSVQAETKAYAEWLVNAIAGKAKTEK